MKKKKTKEQEEEEDNSSSSTERYAVLAAYATFLRKEKGKTTAHATRKRVTGARESSLSSIQWSFQNGSSG
jgi:hypothetical protein